LLPALIQEEVLKAIGILAAVVGGLMGLAAFAAVGWLFLPIANVPPRETDVLGSVVDERTRCSRNSSN
jgi:hypothetical protein